MRITQSLAAVALILGVTARVGAQAPEVKWGPAPAVFPAGARLAVLQGDPGKPGEYTVRLDMPSGYTIAPHFHPTDENVTVVKGTFLVGMGDKVERSKMLTLPTGGFITAGAQMHHYAIAKRRTIVQVHGIGPFTLTYVNPADDPSKKVARK